ncbi:MAG: sialidase family protein [Polaromonas sp.]
MKRVALGVMMASALLAAGCAGVAPRGANQTEYSLAPGVFPAYEKPRLQLQDGKQLLLRYAQNNLLLARDMKSGAEAPISTDYPKLTRLSGLASYSDGQKTYVAWRPKLIDKIEGLGNPGDKFVFAAATADGGKFSKPAKLSNEGGAFMPQITGNGQGDVYAVWQDERSGNGYDLYFNVSHDHGESWKAKEVRVDVGALGESFSAEPSLLADADTVWLGWSEASKKPGQARFTIYARTSSDKGERWKNPVVVATPESEPFFPQLVRSKGRLMMYWLDAQGVKGAVSQDQGASWTLVEGLKGVPAFTQQLLVKTDQAGVVHLIYGAKGEGNDDRNALYYVRSEDGVNFSAPARLNSGPEFQASAVLPDMAFGAKGDMMIAWMDYRFFRPVLMGVYSTDQGRKWSADMLLDDGPESGVSQYPALVNDAGKWLLTYIRYDSVTMAQGRAVVAEINPQALSATALPAAADLNKLDSRVKAWWDSRIKADWAKSYDMADPFMRARTNRKKYIDSQGEVIYYDYEIVKVERLEERRARVHLKYTSEVPELEVHGKKISVPKKTQEVAQDWIWVDGNWYFLFKDLYGKTFLDL